MKKNYISRLREYDARTSLNDKQNLYRKKFITTCYNSADKQNQDPNVAINKKNGSIIKKKTESNKQSSYKKPRGQCVERRDIEEIVVNPYSHQFGQDVQYSPYVSQNKLSHEDCSFSNDNKTLKFQKQMQKGAIQRKKEIITNIQLQCIKLQQHLNRKMVQESKKCSSYYFTLQEQLKKLEENNIMIIRQSFLKNQEILEMKLKQIISCIQCLQNIEEVTNNNKLCDDLATKQTEVQLQFMTIVLNEEIIEKAKNYLTKIDLFNLPFLNNSFLKRQPINAKPNQQSLTCLKQIIQQNETHQNNMELSFQIDQKFIAKEGFAFKQEGQQYNCTISPSFKYF